LPAEWSGNSRQRKKPVVKPLVAAGGGRLIIAVPAGISVGHFSSTRGMMTDRGETVNIRAEKRHG